MKIPMEIDAMAYKPLPEWMRSIEVQQHLKVSAPIVIRLANEGRIGVMEIPGVRRRLYRRADVEALAENGSRPATIQPVARELATA